MPCDDYKLFESVIHITEERDKKSLEKALVTALSDFVDYDALILLRVPHGANSEHLEAVAFRPNSAPQDKLTIIPHEYGDLRVQQDDSISLCIDTRELVLERQHDTQRTLFPIIVNTVLIGMLDIYGCHLTTSAKKLIRGFLRIYSNFLSIIDDNEHDTLTGLLNRKTFDAQLSNLLSSSAHQKQTLLSTDEERRILKSNMHHWVVILDIDFFKKINDDFGHVYGDEVLLLFANLMEKAFRNNDLLFRYGGEEFVVVLAPATEPDAYMVVERFRHKLELIDFPQVGRVTVSIGMIRIDSQDHPSTVLERADQALYYAKEHGRNQVCDYHKLLRSGALKVRRPHTDIELFEP